MQNSQLWYDAGTDHDNTREYVNISVLNENINYGTALAGAYGLIGNDYSPAIFGKGKVEPLEIMMKSQKFTDAFATFGEIELTGAVVAVIE